MADLSFDEVGRILALLHQVGDADVELEWGDLRIEVRRGVPDTSREQAPAQPQESDVPEAGTTGTAPIEPPTEPMESSTAHASDSSVQTTPEHWRQVSAPMAGTFYRSPKPGEPPFVQEGDVVAAGDTVGLIEVMKLFTELKARASGRVVRVDGEDSALVEHEQPLLWIDPS